MDLLMTSLWHSALRVWRQPGGSSAIGRAAIVFVFARLS